MKTTIALNNQSLFDIAIQEYGTIEAVFDLAIVNGLTLTKAPVVGTDIELPISKNEQQILTYYNNNKILPSTGITKQNEQDIPTPDGIGFMAIGSTFIVR